MRFALTAGAVGASAVLGATTASAAGPELGVSGGFGLGFVQYGTGCTYTVTATGGPPGTLIDQVDGRSGGAFSPTEESEPAVFTADWTPGITGRHVLSSGSGASTVVNVEVGYDFGLICATLPERLRLPF